MIVTREMRETVIDFCLGELGSRSPRPQYPDLTILVKEKLAVQVSEETLALWLRPYRSPYTLFWFKRREDGRPLGWRFKHMSRNKLSKRKLASIDSYMEMPVAYRCELARRIHEAQQMISQEETEAWNKPNGRGDQRPQSLIQGINPPSDIQSAKPPTMDAPTISEDELQDNVYYQLTEKGREMKEELKTNPELEKRQMLKRLNRQLKEVPYSRRAKILQDIRDLTGAEGAKPYVPDWGEEPSDVEMICGNLGCNEKFTEIDKLLKHQNEECEHRRSQK